MPHRGRRGGNRVPQRDTAQVELYVRDAICRLPLGLGFREDLLEVLAHSQFATGLSKQYAATDWIAVGFLRVSSVLRTCIAAKIRALAAEPNPPLVILSDLIVCSNYATCIRTNLRPLLVWCGELGGPE